MAATAEAGTDGLLAAKRPGILIAVEPRSYREAIGDALRILRPHLEVAVVDPGDLVMEMMRLDPALVICSLPETSITHYGRPAWFEFCPYEKLGARISIEGRYSEMEEVELADLLSVVDDCAEVADAGY